MVRPVPIAHGPLSRRFDVLSMKAGGMTVDVVASAEECLALASDYGLSGVDALQATFTIIPSGNGLRVLGRVTAKLRQICVVSLDEFVSELAELVDVRFAPDAEVAALEAERATRSEDEDLDDLPDPIIGGRIDLGGLAAEIFALGLDPHPRKPGVAFDDPSIAGADDRPSSPFAVLRRLNGIEPD